MSEGETQQVKFLVSAASITWIFRVLLPVLTVKFVHSNLHFTVPIT